MSGYTSIWWAQDAWLRENMSTMYQENKLLNLIFWTLKSYNVVHKLRKPTQKEFSLEKSILTPQLSCFYIFNPLLKKTWEVVRSESFVRHLWFSVYCTCAGLIWVTQGENTAERSSDRAANRLPVSMFPNPETFTDPQQKYISKLNPGVKRLKKSKSVRKRRKCLHQLIHRYPQP